MSKATLMLLGRLPLLFLMDSILRGTFLDFTYGTHGVSLQPFNPDKPEDENMMFLILWRLSTSFVMMLSMVLVFSPISFILDFYRWIAGAALIWLSYSCNTRYVQGVLESYHDHNNARHSVANSDSEISPSKSVIMVYSLNLMAQLFISLAFDQVSVARTLNWKRNWVSHSRYPMDIILYLSFSLPIFVESVLFNKLTFELSVSLSVILPLIVFACHLYCAMYKVSHEFIVPGFLGYTTHIREIGIDGLLISVFEKANLSWLLRSFFLTRAIYQVVSSTTLPDFDGSLFESGLLKAVIEEILYTMSGTFISILSLSSIVTIISRLFLSFAYKVIQATDDEDSLQPVVSGFLFVLCAMQTGITSATGEVRLQLLFQNSILLIVANQHFVHNVATDLLLKASIDDFFLERHLRPLIPFLFFFSFPFIIVMPLWSFPFRVSWLLAVTVFCIELIVKSISSLIVYSINMVHTYTNVFEDTENLIFYVKAVSGCLEFVCGIFLFLNGAYVFFFESGGFIRLFVMIIHFYCNIYQSLRKGWSIYKLRFSSWEKVNSLDAAKQEQLDENNVCSICYQEMKEAVVLDCSHIFHKNCLQKWISIKEICPLCHKALKKQDESTTDEVNREY